MQALLDTVDGAAHAIIAGRGKCRSCFGEDWYNNAVVAVEAVVVGFGQCHRHISSLSAPGHKAVSKTDAKNHIAWNTESVSS